MCIRDRLYGYFVLPESLDKSLRRPFDWKRANPVNSLLRLKKYPAVGGLIGSLVLIYLAAHAVQSNWTFFNIERFNWSTKMIGISLGIVGVLVTLVQGGLIRVINPRIGNEKSVYFGLALYTIGLLSFAFANQSWMMFAFLVPYCLGGIAGPALQSIISGSFPANEQGELQGALTSLISVTSIFGPLIMTSSFAYFTSDRALIYFPGVSFLIGALFMLCSLAWAYYALHMKPKK